MSTSEKPTNRQVAIRKNSTDSGIAAELVSFLEGVTADGKITDSEAEDLRGWLDQNRSSDLPAIQFLQSTLNHILEDGRITPEERKALHLAVERVLPAEIREKAKERRVAHQLQERLQAADERWRERVGHQKTHTPKTDERQESDLLCTANFMVAGVLHEGRASIIDTCLEPGDTVVLRREPHNAYDENAIAVCLLTGEQIGYVPREDAEELAPLLDEGTKQIARCTKILNGRRAPIPVVEAQLFKAGEANRAANPVAGISSHSAEKVEPPHPGPDRTLLIIIALALVLMLAVISHLFR